MTQKPSIISLDSVQHSYRSGNTDLVALKKTSFKVSNNSFTIIFGPSGSGKSTLLNILSGLQQPSEGTVEYQGVDIYQLRNDDLAHFRASQIGIVYQNNYWVKSLTCAENVAMPLYFMGYTKSRAIKQANEAIEKVGMEKYSHKLPILLSGGEQQRIAMARALVNNPPVVIADEPTGSLDSKNGAKIMETLSRCQSEHGQTIILVTHNMEYLPLADRMIHLEDGEVTVLDDKSIHETTKDLIQSMQQRINAIARNKHGQK